MSRGRRSSELYQVDFVAALFGAFMLIWLSSISDRESAAETSQSATFFQVFVKAYFPKKNDANNATGWIPVIPQPAVSRGCIHPNVIPLFENPERLIRACGGPTGALNKPADGKSYREFVIAQDEVETKSSFSTEPVISVKGLDLRIVLSDGTTKRDAPLLGVALSSIPRADANDYANPLAKTDYVHVAVGVVSGDGGSEPTSIKIRRPVLFETNLYSIFDKNTFISSSLTPVAVRNYYFKNVNALVKPSPDFEDRISKLQVQVTFAKGRQRSCSMATFDLSLPAPDEQELKPC